MPVADLLAEFALTAAPSEDARAMMRLSLYDWLICGLAGQGEPVARIVREQALSDGGAERAALFGGGLVPPRAAALVNGTISHALDYDDTHFAHIGHPSVAVIPAVVALNTGPGAAMLDAALIGAEAAVRTGLWLGRGHYQIGFHQTATAGAFGATVGAARVLGLTPDQTRNALGIAATKAAGLKSQFGTMGKPLNAGLAAETGVVAAQLAVRGFVAAPGGLDGHQGFGPTHDGAADMAAFSTMGTEWLMDGISHKFHACCHGLHAMLEALSDCDVEVGQVRDIVVKTHPRWLSVCNIQDPETGLQAKFSYRHTAAMALSGISTADIANFSDQLANDPGLLDLRRKVTVRGDEALTETQCALTVIGQDGAEKAWFHDLSAPIALSLRADKLRAKGRALLDTGIEELCWNATARQQVNADALQDLISGV